MRRSSVSGFIAGCAILLAWHTSAPAAELKLLLPQSRTAYGDNEWIDLAVVRSDAQALPAAPLTLTVTGEDGSKSVSTFTLFMGLSVTTWRPARVPVCAISNFSMHLWEYSSPWSGRCFTARGLMSACTCKT